MLKLIAQIVIKNIIQSDQMSAQKSQSQGTTLGNIFGNAGKPTPATETDFAYNNSPIETTTATASDDKQFEQIVAELESQDFSPSNSAPEPKESPTSDDPMPIPTDEEKATMRKSFEEELFGNLKAALNSESQSAPQTTDSSASKAIDANTVSGKVNALPEYKHNQKSKGLSYTNNNLKQINDAINEIMAQEDVTIGVTTEIEDTTVQDLKEKERFNFWFGSR